MPDLSARQEIEQAMSRCLIEWNVTYAGDVAGDLAACLLDGPGALVVPIAEWDHDCGQQFEFGRAQGRDDLAADLAPLLALHRGRHTCGRWEGDAPTIGRYDDAHPCPTVAALPAALRGEATD